MNCKNLHSTLSSLPDSEKKNVLKSLSKKQLGKYFEYLVNEGIISEKDLNEKFESFSLEKKFEVISDYLPQA